MPTFHYPQRQPRPVVATTAHWNLRKRQMDALPEFAEVLRGIWARGTPGLAPLNSVETAALAQQHFGTNFRVAGFSSAQMFGLPVGHTPVWIRDGLTLPRAPRAQDLEQELRRPHLSYSGTRGHQHRSDLLITKGSDGAALTGLWDSQTVNLVEALVWAAPFLTDWRIVSCLDHLMGMHVRVGAKRYGPCTAQQIAAVLESNLVSSIGSTRIRDLLPLAQARTWSPMETLVRMMVRRAGLPAPTMNLTIQVDDHGRMRTVHLDLAWEEARVGIEYNGAVHATDRHTYGDEMHRLDLLRDDGWDLRVLVTRDVQDPRRAEAWLSWLAQRLV